MSRITIITPTYNAEKTIETCLHSVHSQSIDCEHVIMDGFSSDGTTQTIKRYQDKSGYNVRLISEPDQGIYDAMNKGIALAKGDIIGILNADDFYASPNALESVIHAFENPDIESCYGDLIYVDADNCNRVTRHWKAGTMNKYSFFNGWMPPHPTFFVKRDVYQKLGDYSLDHGSAADYELMLRFLFKHQITSHYIPRVLITMRSGGVSNASLKNRLLANRMDRLSWKTNNLKPKPWTLLMKPARKLCQYFG